MSNQTIKKNLLKNGIKQYICEDCKLEKWRDQIIPLELHHIDGDNKNNEICNLKLICPNCHALTENYRGKNKEKYKIKKEFVGDQILIDLIPICYSVREVLLKVGLIGAGGNYTRIRKIMSKYNLSLKEKLMISSEEKKRIEEKISLLQEKTKYRHIYEQKTKINWPSKEELEELIKTKSISGIGKQLGVSDNAVRKRAKKYGINIFLISRWSQKHGGRSRT